MDRPPYLDELYELSQKGEFDEVIRRCKKIANELATRSGNTYPETTTVIECLAHAYYDEGDYCAAAVEFQRALNIHRAHCQLPGDPLVRCLMYVGRMLLWTGHPAESEETLTEALNLLDQMPEAEQGGRGFVLADLGQMHLWEGELETAERLFLRAIKLMLPFGYRNRHIGFVRIQLASVYEKQGRTSAADRVMEKAVQLLRLAIDEDDAGFASVLSFYGQRLKKRGRLTEAREMQCEALAILQRIRKPGHLLLERVKHRLAKLDEPSIVASATHLA